MTVPTSAPVPLPAQAKELLDAANYVIVATSNTDGSPQTSVLWATYDGDDLLLSTIQGRKKETNWLRDPRTSVLILDSADMHTYVEVRGTVSMTTDGGPELIERLSQKYAGRRYTGDEGTDNVRVVVRVRPTKVHVR
ncbi:TIGR03618 family F420-dependent PPOX class oxidoreductase [Jatrophihabitans telluris]|uniref:TIGR03618 family F420-dependent PPOX class oxidoreductase n=1 Tax=Jatrophihabitans telluris TaxID=2038343 RepID=A0ABY4R0E7_9ACTN|nr:TIGR03618 family F420-dependent PPOX class oxidoreductase [Jatrophihabitans telluris]UQX88942.1 TIGR03618 family F420-dependent PPOX class oxidoreductase [Jatrophihabitans telluris]